MSGRLFGALLVLLVGLGVAQAVEMKALEGGDYAALRAQRQGRPHAIVLWSVSCAPCLGEMALWRKVLGARRDIDLVLIATDGPDEAEVVQRLFERYAPSQAEAWQFGATPARRLRYEIDPGWSGELPRAYFVEADGRVTAKSGTPEEAALRAWVAKAGGR